MSIFCKKPEVSETPVQREASLRSEAVALAAEIRRREMTAIVEAEVTKRNAEAERLAPQRCIELEASISRMKTELGKS